jgi:hypothetical protein
MDLIKVHRAVMDLIVESPGCYGFIPFFKNKEAGNYLIYSHTGTVKRKNDWK